MVLMMNLKSECGDWVLYGNQNPKILVIGHSHIFSMYLAITQIEKYQTDFGIVAQADFSTHKQQSQSYWDFVNSLAKNCSTALSWNGNQHNIHFLLETDIRFNAFGLSNQGDYPIVPVSQIRELFKPTFDELRGVLKDFPINTNNCLLGTPPPKDKSFLNEQLHTDEYFVNLGKELGIKKSKLAASSNEIRAYMWSITQELTAETALEFNWKYLESPKSTYGKDKILESKYYANDLTHTNESYGVAMLDKISNFYGLSNE
jgi:hypothetical protein